MGQTNDPKSRGTKSRPRAQRFNKARFIQLELTKAEAAELKATEVGPEALFERAQELIEAGYKITVRWDDYSNSPSAWLIGQEGTGGNADCILPARGSTVAKALKQLFYKHWEILAEDWLAGDKHYDSTALDD